MVITSLLIIFAGCLLLQLSYYLLVFARLGFKGDQHIAATESSAGASVVVCACNEVDNLRKLLPALLTQHYPQFEVLVVNDRSTDDTLSFLRSEAEKAEQLKIVTIGETPDHINSKKYGITLGIKAAKYDIILLTDADCIPESEHWVKAMVAPFNNNETKIVLGYSQYITKKGLLNLMIRFETLYTAIQYLSFALAGRPYMGVGRNLAYRKSFFLDKKGFSGYQKVMGGDDDLFVNKNATSQNTAITIGKKSMVYSAPKVSWKAYFIQKKRHLSVGKLYKFKDRVYLGLLFLSHSLFWISFIALLTVWHEPYLIIGGFVVRVFVQYLIFYKAAQKLGDEFKLWMLPLIDVLYLMYYIATGISAVASRNIKWN